MKNKIITLAISFICFIICFTICFCIGYKKGKSSIEIQKDTTVIEKVITQYKPVYKAEHPLDFQKITVPTYVIFPEYIDSSKHTVICLKDSLDVLKHFADSLEIELQRVQRYYVADDYEAWVSGIDPVLDSIKVKQQIHQVTNTHIEKEKMFNLNIGLNANGWSKKSYEFSPNINLSYTKKRVTLTGEVGLQVPFNNTPGTIPYWQIGLNYSLYSF